MEERELARGIRCLRDLVSDGAREVALGDNGGGDVVAGREGAVDG